MNRARAGTSLVPYLREWMRREQIVAERAGDLVPYTTEYVRISTDLPIVSDPVFNQQHQPSDALTWNLRGAEAVLRVIVDYYKSFDR
jgi:hypothetical protein